MAVQLRPCPPKLLPFSLIAEPQALNLLVVVRIHQGQRPPGEMEDTQGLSPCAERRLGSNPRASTKYAIYYSREER